MAWRLLKLAEETRDAAAALRCLRTIAELEGFLGESNRRRRTSALQERLAAELARLP